MHDNQKQMTLNSKVVPSFSGLLCDLLWSDPDKDVQGWGENDRGVSFTFGADVVNKFLHRHDLDLICRAHQVVEDGYEFFAKRQLVTLFSAPNYCGEFDNAGGMMSVDETLMCSFQVSFFLYFFLEFACYLRCDLCYWKCVTDTNSNQHYNTAVAVLQNLTTTKLKLIGISIVVFTIKEEHENLGLWKKIILPSFTFEELLF